MLTNEECLKEIKRLEDLVEFYRRDSLTSIYLRHDLNKRVAELLGMREFTIVMVDIDNLKQCNTDKGYAAGDVLIANVANALCSIKGDNDIFRVGGDEFVMLFTEPFKKVYYTIPNISCSLLVVEQNSKRTLPDILSELSFDLGNVKSKKS